MIYLDNAATSFPKPESVLRAAYGAMSKLGANPGRSGHRLSLAAGRVVANCREALANLMGVDAPERVVFCFNCTDALNTAIFGMLSPGDHVIATALDHNASLRPLTGLEDRGVISLDILEPDETGVVSAAQIQETIKPETRLVALAHASNVTGAIQPAAEIGAVCREAGVPFLLDAAQTMGVLDIKPSELSADMVAFPGHKGLFGPGGTGGLWIGEGIELSPLREGGTGSRSESLRQPTEMPDRFESGTLNLPGIAGLLAGARFVGENREAIEAHEKALAARLREGLRNIDGVTVYAPSAPTVGVVSFNLSGMRSGEAAEQLDARRIAVRAGLHCAPAIHRVLGTMETGAVRASVGYFNDARDVDALLLSVLDILRLRRLGHLPG